MQEGNAETSLIIKPDCVDASLLMKINKDV